MTERIDDSPAGKLMESVVAAIGQFDNDVRADRTRAGMRAAAERGRWVWRAPLGYLCAPPRTVPSLEPDPTLAPLVQEAFRLCAAGHTLPEIRARLTPRGLVTKRGKPVPLQSLSYLLRNRVYSG